MKTTEEVQEAARIVVAFIEPRIEALWPGENVRTFQSGSDPWIEITVSARFKWQYAATDRGTEETIESSVDYVIIHDYDDWNAADVMLLEAAVRRLL